MTARSCLQAGSHDSDFDRVKVLSFKKLETTLALSLWGEKLKMSTLVLNMSDFQQTGLRDIWNLTVSHLVCRGRWRLQALRW